MATESPEAELARARLAYISAGRRPVVPPRLPEVGPAPAADPQPAAGRAATRNRGFTVGWPGPRHVLVVLVLLLVGIGITVAALTRSQASEVELVPETVSPATVPVPAATPSATVQPLRVHVMGAVASPGVVVLREGAIVADALAAAGGLTPESDPAELNLAARLTDGQQIIVGTAGDPRGEVRGQPQGGETASGGKINLNTASGPQLEELPGVGPVLAKAIISWREENGGFRQISDLQSVPGIGAKTFGTLEPLVTL